MEQAAARRHPGGEERQRITAAKRLTAAYSNPPPTGATATPRWSALDVTGCAHLFGGGSEWVGLAASPRQPQPAMADSKRWRLLNSGGSNMLPCRFSLLRRATSPRARRIANIRAMLTAQPQSMWRICSGSNFAEPPIRLGRPTFRVIFVGVSLDAPAAWPPSPSPRRRPFPPARQ